jgi:hypothetical protein
MCAQAGVSERRAREKIMKRLIILGATSALATIAMPVMAQDTSMSFFVTGAGPGKCAALGGLDGADAHCSSLAEAAGVTGKAWRAYLTTVDTDARDRIGAGP